MRKRLQSVALAGAAAAVIAGPAAAGVIISPKSVTVLSGGTASGYDVSNIINQSGLSKTYKSGVTDFDTYVASNPVHAFNSGEWLSDGPTTSATLLFDFGEIIEFTGFAIFNEDATSMRQLNLAIGNRIDFQSGFAGTLYDNNQPFGVDYGATVKNHQTVKGRYLRVQLLGCNAAAAQHNGCGIGEMFFNSTTPAPVAGVPEPATWAMMIMGFMGTGAAIRRRRQGFAAA